VVDGVWGVVEVEFCSEEHKHVFVLLADGLFICQESLNSSRRERSLDPDEWRFARELTIVNIT
jgi:hypothetical protein